MAEDKGLDLILVSPNQEPPVAKILDYGKYKYETEKRAKEAKKKQHTVDIKEIKVRYKIDIHDYNVKINAIKKFLASGNKVKIVVMLRGREMQHNHLAYDLACGIVNAESGVHLKRNMIYLMRFCKSSRLFPIRNKLLVPLPIEDLHIILRRNL